MDDRRIPEGWRECRLGDVANFKTGKMNSNAEVIDGAYPFFTCSPTTLKIDNYAFDTEALILAGNNANGVFSLKYYNGKFNAYQRTYIISINKPQLIGYKFLFYALKIQLFNLEVISHGTATKYLTLPILNQIMISLPPLPEQRAIADVLSSLDDKIDLLNRENQILEQMAEAIFRQWFIEEADEKWEEVPLSFFGYIICGKTPSKKKKEYFGGNIPFIKIPDMHGNIFVFDTSDSLTEEGMNSQKNKTLPSLSICVSCIATVGLVSMTTKKSQTNQQINSIIPKKDFYRYYLYLFMKNSTDLLIAMASGGTATLNLNTGSYSNIEVPLPDENILKSFHNIVEPIYDKIFENAKQIRTLEKLRDTLLPKLMGGDVRVRFTDSEVQK
jgi:type I restriction enzyme S subunit